MADCIHKLYAAPFPPSFVLTVDYDVLYLQITTLHERGDYRHRGTGERLRNCFNPVKSRSCSGYLESLGYLMVSQSEIRIRTESQKRVLWVETSISFIHCTSIPTKFSQPSEPSLHYSVADKGSAPASQLASHGYVAPQSHSKMEIRLQRSTESCPAKDESLRVQRNRSSSSSLRQ